MALGPIADGFFPVVIAVAEAIARGMARTFGVTSSNAVRAIQFLVYALVICPLLLLAVAALVAVVRWLVPFAGANQPYA